MGDGSGVVAEKIEVAANRPPREQLGCRLFVARPPRAHNPVNTVYRR